jgi:hypothetical protein
MRASAGVERREQVAFRRRNSCVVLPIFLVEVIFMARRLKYVKRASQTVAAVQLAVDTRGFTYKKWGAIQCCKARDWIVDNDGDVYTVNRVSFRRTYRQVGLGTYVKKTPVWAEVAAAAGRIKTKEGFTGYQRGDYLVFNQKSGVDGYAVSAKKFKGMYGRAK